MVKILIIQKFDYNEKVFVELNLTKNVNILDTSMD